MIIIFNERFSIFFHRNKKKKKREFRSSDFLIEPIGVVELVKKWIKTVIPLLNERGNMTKRGKKDDDDDDDNNRRESHGKIFFGFAPWIFLSSRDHNNEKRNVLIKDNVNSTELDSFSPRKVGIILIYIALEKKMRRVKKSPSLPPIVFHQGNRKVFPIIKIYLSHPKR